MQKMFFAPSYYSIYSVIYPHIHRPWRLLVKTKIISKRPGLRITLMQQDRMPIIYEIARAENRRNIIMNKTGLNVSSRSEQAAIKLPKKAIRQLMRSIS
jgi:hypothetical protein